MLEAGPAGFDRLSREGASAFEDGERGHHRHLRAAISKHLLDGKQAALEHQRVEGRFRQQHINAAVEERLDLLPVGGHHFVKSHIAVARISHVASN